MKIITILMVVFFASVVFGATPPEGTYEWISTEESAGVFITPLDLGYTVQREFNADLTYNEYRDEELFRSGDFWVADVEFMGVIIPALYIEYTGGEVDVCAFGYLPDGLDFYWGADPGGWPSFPREILSTRGPVPTTRYTIDAVKSLYR